ncbi:MAG: PilZ domain-containing protein [Acidobacteria bacterium]|nr:PilZ domain-containing protein [Acidobacteriota bacterium]
MSAAVVIGSADLLPALVSRAGLDDETLTFSDSEPLEALQAINEHQPRLVVLERLFAATSRGAALINRLKSDPSLAETEIRVLSHAGDYSRVIARPAAVGVGAATGAAKTAKPPEPGPVAPAAPGPPAAVDAAGRPLDWHGTRRSPRFRARPGLEIQLDGDPVSVIDMSVIGAQVLSPGMVRPGQRVRVTITREGGNPPIRFRGVIAWARFELPRRAGDPGPHYRVGIEFIDADKTLLERFCQDNKAVER